jgi:hypothetical protein
MLPVCLKPLYELPYFIVWFSSDAGGVECRHFVRGPS